MGSTSIPIFLHNQWLFYESEIRVKCQVYQLLIEIVKNTTEVNGKWNILVKIWLMECGIILNISHKDGRHP